MELDQIELQLNTTGTGVEPFLLRDFHEWQRAILDQVRELTVSQPWITMDGVHEED